MRGRWDDELYTVGPASEVRARILLIQFDGAMDAGLSARMASAQMLRTLKTQRVATFDSDYFLDFRSHRPVMTVENWVSKSVDMPEIALDVVHDDVGQPFLLLHGPEPDAKWETFVRIVTKLVKDAGVEIAFSFHGIPSGVPHTRPVPVHVQATDASLIPDQPQMATVMQFPSPMSSFLLFRLAEQGINGVTLLGSVPYYTSESPYPAAASAILGSLSDMTDLSLPVGDLEQGAAKDQNAIEQLIDEHPEISHTVSALEEHYDAWAGQGLEGFPLGALSQRTATTSESKEPKDIGDVIEAYLANVNRLTDDDVSPARAQEETESSSGNTLEDVLRRVRFRRENPDAPRQAAPPRHRAPQDDLSSEESAEDDVES